MQKRTTPALAIGAALVASMLTLAGCAHKRVPPDNSTAKQDAVRSDNHDAQQAVDPNTARLTFTSSGMPMIVAYSMSDSPRICRDEDFKPVGRVFYSGRDVLIPWIAKMTEVGNKGLLRTETERQRVLQPGVPVQIKGAYGDDSVDRDRRYAGCGPLVSAFTPEAGHKYHVDFAFQGTASCSQGVMDVTDPKNPVPAGHPVACVTVMELISVDKDNTNYLKDEHEKELGDARQEQTAAAAGANKVSMLKDEAAALDSLGQSKEALDVIDRALAMAGESDRRSLIATKAGILFSLNDPQAALTLLAPEIDSVRKQAASQPAVMRMLTLSSFTEGFVTATFAHMQLSQWNEAIDTLADAQSPLEGPRFLAYRGLLYRYIMARAQNPSLANAALEHDAAYYAEHDGSHYGALLRMWRGDETDRELEGTVARMSGADRQEARGEVLFYQAAYLKFVKDKAAGAKVLLGNLNQLAPYGSVEWIYGQRVLQ